MELSQVIKKPIISEKSVALTKEGKYSFRVDKKADKKLVAKAVTEFFKVEVKKIGVVTSKQEINIRGLGQTVNLDVNEMKELYDSTIPSLMEI